MKASDIRKLSERELTDKLEALKEELFNLKFQLATGQLDNPMRVKEVKRDIARALTIMNERDWETPNQAAGE